MIKKILVLVLVCVGGGWLTGLLTQTSVKEWYPTLIKSPLTPKDVVFPIVWTILYFCMALSAALVWQSKSPNKARALSLFFIQLVLNFSWSWIFFYLKRPDFALIDICLLWAALAYTVVLFWNISKTAGLLLLPYLIWVSFAVYLNLYIYIHN
ncbi:MAG: tryptophan-rich sensory protein [Verrucomicrobia bacterium]|nr:tryptophan-rich sensory protein [Verrucomicrobiota bacterium]MBS0637286.1 tryptophan-rich sensory protein [Verrucomicrobiota bacterium]